MKNNNFIFLLIFLWASTSNAQLPETWTLAVSSNLSGMLGPNSIEINAEGKATIKANPDGDFAGSGTMTVNELISGAGYRSSLQGVGSFSVSGRRDGKYLIFTIPSTTIPLNGTISVAGMNMQHEGNFDPSTCAPVEIAIEREEGATTRNDLAETGINVGLTGITTFTLSGGSNIVKEEEPPKGTFPEEANIWTLELEANQNYSINASGISGTGADTISGQAQFPLPLGEGVAEGEGPISYQGKFDITTPQPANTNLSWKGSLILDGVIRNDSLTFTPKSKLETSDVQRPTPLPFSASTDMGQGQWIFKNAGKISIPVENGAQFIHDVSLSQSGMVTTGKWIWRLSGKKIEHWRITIDDYRINYILYGGSGPGPSGKRCGLKVHARRVIEVTIENDKFKNGRGEASFVSIRSYSNPPWAYTCKAVTTTIIGTGSDVDVERFDQAHWAKRFNPPKNDHDAALKKKWENIKKHKTPYIFPEKFTVRGKKTGSKLDIFLPENSGYTLGIYLKLNVVEVEKRGFKITEGARLEALDIDTKGLFSIFTVTLADGWTHADAPPEAIERTVLTVERIRI